MRRYRFRFEHVERVRRIQEEQARAELLAARRRLIDAGADLSRRVEQYQSERSVAGPARASQFRAGRDRDALLSDALVAARAAEANAMLVVGQRLDSWTEAARRVSAMERLDERLRERHEEEVAREEQAALDDLVAPRLAATRDKEER